MFAPHYVFFARPRHLAIVAITEGLFWGVVVSSLVFSTFLWTTPAKSGLFAVTSTAAWDMTWAGWSRELCYMHVVADLIKFHMYVVIAFVMLRLHPVSGNYATGRMALLLMSTFLFIAASNRLLDAYCIFRPAYLLLALMKLISAGIDTCFAVVLAISLASIFRRFWESKQDAMRTINDIRTQVDESSKAVLP